MIRRLIIKDYMAHENTVLELAPGVTVLTGPNNTGKSAVVEAIRSLAQNPVPHHVIRHGAGQAMVRAELDSGEIVEWVRSRGSTVYHLYRIGSDLRGSEGEGEIFAKFGRTPPQEVREVLRLDPVETETGCIDIHIGNQRYPVFLIDQTGSQAASFFAASTEAEYLLRMQQALKMRTDRAKGRRKEFVQECEELEGALRALLPLDALEEEVSRAEQAFDAIQALQRSIPLLDEWIRVVEELEGSRVRKALTCELLRRLEHPPDPLETETLERLLQDAATTAAQLALFLELERTTGTLLPPPSTAETEQLDLLTGAMEKSVASLQHYSLQEETLGVLTSPPQLLEVADLERVQDEMKRGEGLLSAAKEEGAALEALIEPPGTMDTHVLGALVFRMESILKDWERCRLERERLDTLQAPGDLHGLPALDLLVLSMEETTAQLERVGREGQLLGGLRSAPEPLANTPLEDLIGQLERIRQARDSVEDASRKVSRMLALKRDEVATTLKTAGLCPLCGHALDMQHFLEAGHGR